MARTYALHFKLYVSDVRGFSSVVLTIMGHTGKQKFPESRIRIRPEVALYLYYPMGKIVILPLKHNFTHKFNKFVNIGAGKHLCPYLYSTRGHGELVVAEMFRQRES